MKRFSGQPVLREVSLTVAPGEFVAVVGASGAGKSTLFRCLARLTEPDGGTIAYGGRPFEALRGRALNAARRDVGLVFQQHNLVRRLTAIQNVMAARLAETPYWRVALRRFSAADEARAGEALDRVGLWEKAHQRADTLSGGQQQRVAIARALAQGSRVLLADEPVASLDPRSAERVLTIMKTLAEDEGIAVLCSLHQPDLAARFADRILAMEAGRLEEVPAGRPAAPARLAGEDAEPTPRTLVAAAR